MDLITPFVLGMIQAVPNLVANWIETRNAIRVENTRARLTESQEQASHRRSIEMQELNAVGASYPLGAPGRLRTLYAASGLPKLLVSPLPPEAWLSRSRVPQRIHEIL